MQKFLRALRARKWVIVTALVLGFLFYWFQLRPIYMYRACAQQASADARTLLRSKADLAKGSKNAKAYAQLVEKNMYLRTDYESFLRKCLLYYGLPEDALKVGTGENGNEPMGKKDGKEQVSKK